MKHALYVVEVKAYTEYAHSVVVLDGPFSDRAKAIEAWEKHAEDYEDAEDVDIDRGDEPHILIADGDCTRTILIAEQ